MKRRKSIPQPPKSAKPSTVRSEPLPPRPQTRTSKQIGRIISDEDASVLDLIDNLLAKGVMLNADLVLALADVDLIYVRLSALLCAADRVMPGLRRHATRD